jgi:PTH1 family peptidyl-tRNA hydrolase
MSSIFDLFNKIREGGARERVPLSHIVAGLGNPGTKYSGTRHNAGFFALDYIAQKQNAGVDRVKFHALTGETVIDDKRVLLMAPQNFMNNSGAAIAEAATFYKIPPANIIIIYDDTEFDCGIIRVKRSGSDGGHNGMKSVIEHLKSDAFPRIRIGIGKKPHPEYDLADYVLSEFSAADKKLVFSALDNVYNAAKLIIGGNVDEAMTQYNKKNAK